MKNTVASIQMSSTAEINKNLATIDRLVLDAKNRGAKLALLPENCICMGKTQDDARKIAEPLGNGHVQTALANIAQQHDIWLFVGSFAIIENNSIYQTLLVYDNHGALNAHYHKRHLFNVTLPGGQESYRESDVFDTGKDVCTVNTPVGRVGLTICYDLRFPELFRKLIDLGTEIFVMPAAFTYITGKAHWEVLLRARAIENQCYLIASAQYGIHASGRRTWGHSMILNPWGDILSKLDDGEGVITAEIDLHALQHQRKVFPVLTHR